MAAVTGSTITEIAPNAGLKVLAVETPASADDGDTVEVNLNDHGATTLIGIQGFTQSTTGSVVITEAPTTAVSSGVLTITIGGSTDNKARTFIVYAK